MSRDLTTRERLALTLAALAGVFEVKLSRYDIYKLASPKSLQTLDNAPNIAAAASNFFKHSFVADFYRVERARFAAQLENIKRQAIGDFCTAHGLTPPDNTTRQTTIEAAADYIAAQLIAPHRSRPPKNSTISKTYNANELEETGTGTGTGGSVAALGSAVLDFQLSGKTDYTDRAEMLAALNDQANRATDDKTRLDILKLISSIQQYSQAPCAENQEIMRYYMPLRCLECAIYKDAKKEENHEA